MLTWVTGLHHIKLGAREHAALHRLVDPMAQVPLDWNAKYAKTARNLILTEVHRRQAPWWRWSEDVWAQLATDHSASARNARFQLVAIAHRLGGHHRLHHRVRICHLGKLAEAVFGRDAVQPALQEVRATLLSWKASERTMSVDVTNALLDLLITCGSPHLADITEAGLHAVLADHRSGRSSRRMACSRSPACWRTNRSSPGRCPATPTTADPATTPCPPSRHRGWHGCSAGARSRSRSPARSG